MTYPLLSIDAERTRLEKQFDLQGGISFLPISEVAPPARVLDVGCGTGVVLRRLAEEWPQAELHGLDQDAKHLHFAKEQLREEKIEFHLGDANSLPFDDLSFDLVYCRLLLWSIKDVLKVIQEMGRVAKVGGIVAAKEGYNPSLLLFPKRPHVENFYSAFRNWFRSQGLQGGVGPLLYTYFQKAGLTDVQFNVQWCWSSGSMPEQRDQRMDNWLGAATHVAPNLIRDRFLTEDEFQKTKEEFLKRTPEDFLSETFWNVYGVRQ